MLANEAQDDGAAVATEVEMTTDDVDGVVELQLEALLDEADPLEALLSEVGSGSPAVLADAVRCLPHLSYPSNTWFSLVEVLLHYCATHESEYFSVVGRGATGRAVLADCEERQAEATVRVHGCLTGSGGAVVPSEVADRLRAVVNDLSADATNEVAAAVRVAHAVASEIDDCLAETFEEAFHAEIEKPLRAGRAFPVNRPEYDGEALLGGSANTRMSRRPKTTFAETDHVHLVGQVADRVRFTVSYDAFGRLGELSVAAPLRIAACQPNLSLGDFDIDGPERGRFANRGPLHSGDQADVVRAQLEAAIDAGAHVVVFPEYSINDDGKAALVEVVAKREAPALVIAGSCISALEDPAQNRGAIIIPRGAETPYTKNFPAEVSQSVEDIEVPTPPEITILRSGDWTICVLLCRDAAATDIVNELAGLGVNLCVVPAFTNRLGTIVGSVLRLRTDAQAFVVAANTPAVWEDKVTKRPSGADRTEAVFDGPYERSVSPIEVPNPEIRAGSGPGLWLFNSATRSVDWLDAPS